VSFVDSKNERVDEFERANKCRDTRSSASMLDRSSAVAVFHGLPLYGEIYRALFAFSLLPLTLLPLSIPRRETRWLERNARSNETLEETERSRKASSSLYRETHSSLWNASGGWAQTEEDGKVIVIRKHRWIRKEITKEICFRKSNVF